jgi:GT2 family glycosyltransferase
MTTSTFAISFGPIAWWAVCSTSIFSGWRAPGGGCRDSPAWLFTDTDMTRDEEYLSGVVGHGTGFPPEDITVFGPPFQEVKLLDGVMLIARSETLLSKGISFDERFDFHFYDMDFCRQAELQNLRMGTWSISVIHESAGAFGSPAWHAAYRRYLEKWGS